MARFAECYEALRAQALGESAGGVRCLGLALFLRRGLPAWLQSCGNSPSPPLGTAAVPVAASGLLAPPLHAAAAMVLANMVLGARREVHA